MNKILLYEHWKELYKNFLMTRPIQKQRDFTYKGGGLNVTITTNKGNYRKVTEGD